MRQNINITNNGMNSSYNVTAYNMRFSEGDLVGFYNPERKKGLLKLPPFWEGPYNVVKMFNDVVYRI